MNDISELLRKVDAAEQAMKEAALILRVNQSILHHLPEVTLARIQKRLDLAKDVTAEAAEYFRSR
jgi:predicted DNA-binding protein (UPF0251 family)